MRKIINILKETLCLVDKLFINAKRVVYIYQTCFCFQYVMHFCFILTAPGPAECSKCLENDADTCTLQQDTQTCSTDSHSLGETHCGSAKIKFRDVLSGSINVSVIRGCIDCAGGPVIGTT